LGPSLFESDGFAISFGADDINKPEAYPRLEFYFRAPTQGNPALASFVSMTDPPLEGFSGKETAMLFSGAVLHKTITDWLVFRSFE